MENSNLERTAEDKKLLLLNTVSRKVIEMTKELPGLDILDFNISKGSKKVSLSIGYKTPKPPKKFDLSEILRFDQMEPRMATHQDFQPNQECEIHNKECPFSTIQNKEDLDTEKPKSRMPMSQRPEFRDRSTSPGLELMQNEIVKIITDSCKNDPRLPVREYKEGRNYDSDGEDNRPNWFNTFVNTDIEKMDTDYFQALLSQRAEDPDNAAIQKRIDNFLTTLDSPRDNTDVDEDGFREFIPGQQWMSRAERRRQDLDVTMDGIEDAITRQKTNAFMITYDILKQAQSYERQGRSLSKEIQKALKEDERVETKKKKNKRQQTQDRRNKESLKAQFDTEDQVEDDCNNILEEAFTEINKKMQQFEEKKKVRFDNKKEEDDHKTEALKIGSFGSTMFSY